MNLQTKLKIALKIIDKKSNNPYNAIKFDFKQKFIAAANRNILLKINHDFDFELVQFMVATDSSFKVDYELFHNKEGFCFNAVFKDKEIFCFNPVFLNELIKYLDTGYNMFEALEKNFDKYEYSEYYPNIDAIRFSSMQPVSSIAYNTKTILSVIQVCNALKMGNISFNFDGVKNPTQIKNDVAEIIFMPISIYD
jgi:hypothetical protein